MPDQPPQLSNPYAPPQSAAGPSRPPRRAAFTVGETEQHLFEVFFSSWSGVEVYAVDGREVRRIRNLSWRAEHRFEVGEVEKHVVTIKFDLMRSWRSFFSPDDWIAEAYVDDKLVVADVLADLREYTRKSVQYSIFGLLFLLGLLIFLLLLLALLAGLLAYLRAVR